MACLLFSSVLIDQTLSLLPYRRPDRNIKRKKCDQLENLLELPFYSTTAAAVVGVIYLFCLSTFFFFPRCRHHHHHHHRHHLYACFLRFIIIIIILSSFLRTNYIWNHPRQQDYCLLLTVSISRFWHNNFWPVAFLSSRPTLITWYCNM